MIYKYLGKSWGDYSLFLAFLAVSRCYRPLFPAVIDRCFPLLSTAVSRCYFAGIIVKNTSVSAADADLPLYFGGITAVAAGPNRRGPQTIQFEAVPTGC
jgi:hypothetical protein